MHSLTGRSSTGATDLNFVQDGAPLLDVVIPLTLNGNSFLSLNNGATPLTLGSDYMINGSALTIKASALAAYASGAFGEKTVLTVNFCAGPGWTLHVRHNAIPVLATASGTKSAGIVIPAALNGDLVPPWKRSMWAPISRIPGRPNGPRLRNITRPTSPTTRTIPSRSKSRTIV
jgi:endoglucanase